MARQSSQLYCRAATQYLRFAHKKRTSHDVRSNNNVLELMRHFRFGHDDMLAQFRVIFTKLHLARSVFRLGILGRCIEITSFFVFQFYNFFAAFLGCHFLTFYLFWVGFYCKNYWKSSTFYHNMSGHGRMAKLVDALDLGSSGATHQSSNLCTPTKYQYTG